MVTTDYLRFDQSSAMDSSDDVACATTMAVSRAHVPQQHDRSVHLQPQLVRWDPGWSEDVEKFCGDRHLLF